MYKIPSLPLQQDLDTIAILKQLNRANRKLAELKGLALTIPNENILIDTLVLQEAKESSEVENIVTTHDELYQADANAEHLVVSLQTKEVLHYCEAMKYGFSLVRKNKLLSLSMIKEIQRRLEQNNAGFRAVPGTSLRNQRGEVVYEPPQDKQTIEQLMGNLEQFLNDDALSNLDPLIKMAIIHHQFESIHPFYDGNGRIGRIINILFLVVKDLLDLPILYLSRYIIDNKAEYYKQIQDVRESGDWEPWILFMLKGVEETAINTIRLVNEISILMKDYKVRLKNVLGKSYRHELLNNLFRHPYTKIEFIEREMEVSRFTASRILDKIVKEGLLEKAKRGKSNYFLNNALIALLTNQKEHIGLSPEEIIESVTI